MNAPFSRLLVELPFGLRLHIHVWCEGADRLELHEPANPGRYCSPCEVHLSRNDGLWMMRRSIAVCSLGVATLSRAPRFDGRASRTSAQAARCDRLRL